MFITKSLLVEFITCPKLAWRHMHDKKTYKAINEDMYGAMDGLAVGQATEDMVLQLYANKEVRTVNMDNINFTKRHQSCHERTQKAMLDKPEVLYQGSFLAGDLFTKSDLLVLNKHGSYDLIEVKSKNAVRAKTKAAPILDELLRDVSFQDYVLTQALGDLYSGRSFLAYLDSEFVKNGPIDPKALIMLEEVSGDLISHAEVKQTADLLRKNISLAQDQFEVLYPYTGEGYMMYFGQPKPKDSIWTIPRINKKVLDFFPHKTHIADFTEQDIISLYNNKGEPTRASHHIQLWQEGQTVVDKQAIQQRFYNELKYPLYFYDYETISWPVPIFEKTSPRQQVVVQYSLHKIDADGSITHKEAIIQHGEQDNKRIVDQLIQDFEGGNGTYIVWYKGFENTRNKEMMAMFPKYAQVLEKVNANTFDLMEIFSEQLYFDRRFQGSSSIKKVLPVLTDISYDGMNVPNGAVAADLLRQIAQGENSLEVAEKGIQNLLEYCKQDTRAMVRIWEEVKKKIS